MKKQHEEKEGNRERWLLTYADLITLLMIFFVVLYAISAVDAKKFQALASALTVQFGGGRTVIGEYQGASTIQLPAPSPSASLETLREDTQDLLTKQGMQESSSASVVTVSRSRCRRRPSDSRPLQLRSLRASILSSKRFWPF